MNKIIKKRQLAENVIEYVISAPDIARTARAGQFVILITDENGERVPFTICDCDRTAGTVALLVQTVGLTTAKLAKLKEGDYLFALVGPLGKPTDLSAAKEPVLVGGGIGIAVIHAQAKELALANRPFDVIIGARDASLLVYEEALASLATNFFVMTDNGSKGGKGFVTDKLASLISGGKNYDTVFAVGPLMMMKAVSDLTKTLGIRTIISMNSIMVDGTGMCGSCRLTVDGQTKYACVDGPEFDAHKVDFNEALIRSRFYSGEEQEAKCKIR
ncbi:MAG: sulfide/dihydroorotate dehydrogenase-like FAD/NAD-binding protein [Clostridia bacterium]